MICDDISSCHWSQALPSASTVKNVSGGLTHIAHQDRIPQLRTNTVTLKVFGCQRWQSSLSLIVKEDHIEAPSRSPTYIQYEIEEYIYISIYYIFFGGCSSALCAGTPHHFQVFNKCSILWHACPRSPFDTNWWAFCEESSCEKTSPLCTHNSPLTTYGPLVGRATI